jgi:DNA (cytosine-5)-methyltransferase 1
LAEEFALAEQLVGQDTLGETVRSMGKLGETAATLGSIKHNGRGVVLTLALCKAADRSLDPRAHKDEHKGGFNARRIDTQIVVLFLRENELAHAAESHWLTQVFSSGPYRPNTPLSTVPREAGRLVPQIVCALHKDGTAAAARAVARVILACLIQERNRSRIALTKPKGLTIESVISLLKAHFSRRYRSGAPRLPQLAVYAMYQSLLTSCLRYKEAQLLPLDRLKTANRKAGTVGDVDIVSMGRPVEAVEIKHELPISKRFVSDAIEKIKTADVKRYYLLSTGGVKADELPEISDMCQRFYRANGCEIIVNGIYETLTYYLRLLGSSDEFLANYVDLISADDDLDYEHRLAWNEVTSLPQSPG